MYMPEWLGMTQEPVGILQMMENSQLVILVVISWYGMVQSWKLLVVFMSQILSVLEMMEAVHWPLQEVQVMRLVDK